MYTLRVRINGIRQLDRSGYHDRNDVFRKANEMWGQRHTMFRILGLSSAQGTVEFEVVSDDGSVSGHQKILAEIRRRPELREPPRMY